MCSSVCQNRNGSTKGVVSPGAYRSSVPPELRWRAGIPRNVVLKRHVADWKTVRPCVSFSRSQVLVGPAVECSLLDDSNGNPIQPL